VTLTPDEEGDSDLGRQATAVDRRGGVRSNAEAQQDHDESGSVARSDHHEEQIGRADERGGVP
jgi:hypothetical protein